MDPTPNSSHIKSVGHIRELEGTITKRFGNRSVSYDHLSKEYEEIHMLWNKYKKSTDVQSSHAEDLKEKYGRQIQILEEADTNPNSRRIWSKEEKEAQIFLKDYEKASKNESYAKSQLKASLEDIGFYHAELDKIANQYVSINKLPEQKNPLYNDLILRIAIIKSQPYKLLIPSELKEKQSRLSPEEFNKLKDRTPLPKEDLSRFDKALEPVVSHLIKESKNKPKASSGIYLKNFKDLVKVNAGYAAYLLTKVPFSDAQSVTELLFRELQPAATAALTLELVRHELATCNTPETFLRQDGVKERFIAKFQEEQTKPVLDEAYRYIRNLYIDKTIELDPARKKSSGFADQQDIKMLATSSLRKIVQTISEKGMPESMSTIYRTILNSEFGNEESLIASLLFLRSICPNLLMTDEKKGAQQRNSILLNKVLTFIVNKAEPDKEQWLKFIVEPPSFVKSSQPAIKQIVQLITKPNP